MMVVVTVLMKSNPQDSTHTQTIRGTITDISSGAPLQGATVRILQGSKVLAGGISNKRGEFSVKNVTVGRRTISISFLGYEPYVVEELLVTSGKEVVIQVQLTPSYSEVAAVAVEYDRLLDAALMNNEFVNVSGRTFNAEDTKRYAGSLGDPSRMAANYAGVVGANDSRNDIVVRGNSPAGMLWQMQGMNIPNPNHFGSLSSTGGPVSILNNNVLEKSDFITSAFPAMYGNALSGAFDIKLRDGNTSKYEFLAQMGFNGLEFGAEGPLWEGASFLLNYRYSTLAVFNAVGLDIGTGGATPLYQDLTFKFQSPLSEHGRLEAFLVGGISGVDFYGNDADTTRNDYYNDRYRNTLVDYTTWWSGASYEHRFGESTTAKLTIGANATTESFKGDTIMPSDLTVIRDSEAEFETRTVSVVASVKHKFSRTTNMIVGGYVDIQNYNIYNIDNIASGNAPFVNMEDNATLSQAYVHLRHRLMEWLTVSGGLHAQHYTIANKAVVEPRIGITAIITPELSINAGYGLHGQRQNIYTYNVQTSTATGLEFTNRNLGFSRSHHSVLGADWFITSDVRMKAEAYYQNLFDIPVTIAPSSYSALNFGAGFAPDNTDSLVNNGTGTNLGLELTLEHFFRNGFYGLATVSVFDSKYKGSDGVERNTAFNTGYVVNVLGGKEFAVADHSVLGLNIRFSTTGGRYLTPIDEAASQMAGRVVFDESRAFSQRQTAYLRLDLKLLYRIEFAGSSLEFALDLQNVTNHKNIFSQGYNPATGKITTEYQQGFFPVPMIRYTF